VEQVEFPSFNPLFKPDLSEQDLERLGNDETPRGIERLKDYILKVWSDVPEPYRTQLVRATNHAEIEAVTEALLAKGRRNRFKVLQTFRGTLGSSVEIWTDFSDCQPWFQKGESYLVYADIRNARLETSACSRTAMLADAGSDLAYLILQKSGGAASLQLDGFVTSDAADSETARSRNRVVHPIEDAVLELTSNEAHRFASTDRGGLYTFNGLAEGVYSIVVFGPNFPEERNQLAGPIQVRLNANSCSREVIVVPPK
jgi:hypothetical protein